MFSDQQVGLWAALRRECDQSKRGEGLKLVLAYKSIHPRDVQYAKGGFQLCKC